MFNIAGAMYFVITNSSVTLRTDGVKEIGRKCLLTSVAGFTFGNGMMSACFHIDSNLCSSKEELIILQTGFASITAYVLHNQFAIPSGPLAFRGLIPLSRLHVSSSVNSKVSTIACKNNETLHILVIFLTCVPPSPH